MHGYGQGVLPNLSSLEMSNPKQQEWFTTRLTVISVVVQTMNGNCGDFQRLLKAVPNLRTLKLYADDEIDGETNHDMQDVTSPVLMEHLETLIIGDSHRMSLDLFTAQALRRFSYRIDHTCDVDCDYARSIMELQEVRRFIFWSNIASKLQTLMVNIAWFPIEREWVETLVEDLVALTKLVLCLGGEEPYRGLQNQDLPALKTARFHIFSPPSVMHIADFAQSHTGVETVEITWITDPDSELRLDHGMTSEVMRHFGELSSEGQAWNEVGPGHYKLDR